MIFRRLPFRGLGWVLAFRFGGIVLIVRPRLFVQVLAADEYFDPPYWMRWRI